MRRRRKFSSRLRSERLKWGLTQRELAPLLLIRHAAQISRIERGICDPSIKSAVASCVVFGKNIYYLFPGLGERIRRRVVSKSRHLTVQVERDKTSAGKKKLQLLSDMASGRQDVWT